MDGVLERFAPLGALVDKVLDPVRAVPRPTHEPLWQGKIGAFNLVFYPEQFYVQGALLALALVYALLALVGRWRNRRVVRPWTDTYVRALRDEFALVGADEAAPLVWNGAADAMLFASGRRGVDTLHATVQLAPRHDVLRLVGSFVYDTLALPETPTQTADRVTLTFRLPRNDARALGTLALIDKHHLQDVRRGRYDLLFAKVADGERASAARRLDERFAIASENGDVTDRFVGEPGARGDEQRERLGLVDALNGPAGRFVESFVVTDQPETRPAASAPAAAARVALTLRLPRSVRDAEATLPALAAALDVVDALHLATQGRSALLALRPETQAALRKTRVDVARALEAEESRDAEQEAQDEREEARRRAQQDKFDKLSPAEQAKRKQVEKRRAQRKMQQTQSVRRR
ncbi:hypothetical protein MOBT1_000920 [Malassezia obtusa]|uniref:DUF1682 domain-containing protein n=1 Tax=Malassezia obtusa TaxID=76774 RepID=A0AAF0ISJ7_9BASI|nr:hypothetical protein MOBT1_000920 [Malassezia obtusa]